MKIKKTIAPTVREAMNKIRQDQGSDAVILSNRKVAGGVEIISATDYDIRALDELAEQDNREKEANSNHQLGDDVEMLDDPPTTLSYKAVSQLAQNNASANISVENNQTDADSVVTSNLTYDIDKSSPKKYQKKLMRSEEKEDGFSSSHHVIANKEDYFARQGPSLENIQSLSSRDRKAVPLDEAAFDVDIDRTAHDQNQWQQSQMIFDLKEELHSLRDLMKNQLSVLEWDTLARQKPSRFDALARITELGIDADVANQVINKINLCDDTHKMWRLALGQLADEIPIAEDDLIEAGGIVALVGPTGVGKTTTAAKLAARFLMRHGQKSVGLISTDSYRIGAHEQLQHYARILGVPLKTAHNREEIGAALDSFLDKKLILIDTPGMSQRDMRLNEQMVALRDSFAVMRIYLVLAANTQLGALDEAAKGFGRADLSAVIITKLDETTSVGAAITVAIRHKLPLAYLGVGQRVPEDLQIARAHRLVSRAVPMMSDYSDNLDKEKMAMRFGSGVARAGI